MKSFHISLFVVFSFVSCNQIQDKVKDEFKTQSDKFFPKYDHNLPDSENNKQRFEDFFGFAPTSDVDSIFCFADEIGIDHDYSFSFNCNQTTIHKICNNLKLTNDSIFSTDFTSLFHDLKWWDKDKIKKLKPYWTVNEHQTHYFLWFDSTKAKAFYFEFDL